MRPLRYSRRCAAAVLVIVTILAAAACTRTTNRTAPSPTVSPAGSPSLSPTPTPSGGPLVASLPDGCTEATPSATATVAFVADGRAWIVGPDGIGLSCLFETADPGSFQWGPRADRVVVGGLQVLGVGSDAARPAGSIKPGPLSWGRPQGIAMVFVDSSGRHLDKALIGNGSVSDITPLPRQRFSDVVYHPSGLAIAFVGNGSDGSAIYMSSNTGADPKRLVFTMMGTRFGPIAFDPNGLQLYYAARLPGGKNMLAAYDLTGGNAAEHLWDGDSPVLRIAPRNRGKAAMLLDVGTGCADRQAVLSDLDRGSGSPALPDAGAPTTGLGWLDARHVLIGEGACDQPAKLWVVGVDASAAPTSQVLLFDGAGAASVRVPDRLPTPGLPDIGVPSGFA